MRVSRGILAGALGTAILVSLLPEPAHAVRANASVTLSLVAYSTPQEAYAKIIPAFQKTSAGQGVQFKTSYGASGEPEPRGCGRSARRCSGNFSLAPDMTRLVSAGLVAKNWNGGPPRGWLPIPWWCWPCARAIPSTFTGWNDLIKSGIDVITPNPFTSGGARWNIMAAYGAQLHQGKTQAQAVSYLKSLFSHVSVQNASAREELQTFLSGKGDVMIAYENDVIAAQQ